LASAVNVIKISDDVLTLARHDATADSDLLLHREANRFLEIVRGQEQNK
jgi:hypothetical protein